MANTLWKLPTTKTQKYVGQGNRLLSLVKPPAPIKQLVHHIRFFDKKSFDFVGEVEMIEISEKYLRKLFKLKKNDPVLLSYAITPRQKKYMEKLSGLKINLDKYDYFMEG